MKTRALRVVLPALAIAMVVSAPVYGKRKFCISSRHNWIDGGIGEDYQYVNPGGQWLYGVWIDVQRNGASMSGFPRWLDHDSPCTADLDAPAGTYVVRTTMSFKPRSDTWVQIYVDDAQHDAGQMTYFTKNFGSLPASIGGQTAMHTVNVGYGYTSVWSTTNVGALVGRLGNLDYGLRPGTYNIHAADTFGSVFSGDEVHIGWDPAYGYNYQSKWIIAHELGHAVEERLIGEYLGSSDYSDNPSETTCRCDSYISGADGQHCLQSREVVQAAIGEGWAQFFAASLFNNPAGSTAWFGYYKKSLSFTNPNVNDPILPPRGVSVIPTSEYRWMETRNCVGTDKGVEVDWMGFWYYVHNKTSNKYSFDEIEDVYEQMCNGTCVLDTADKPTWSKLRTAAETLYSGSKESHFVDNGVEYGVNH